MVCNRHIKNFSNNRVVWFDKQKLLLDGAIGCCFGSVFEIKNKKLIKIEDLEPLKADTEISKWSRCH